MVNGSFRASSLILWGSAQCHKRTVEYVLQQSLDQVIELPLNERELLFTADSNPISAFLDCSNHAATNLIPFFKCLAIMKIPCPRESLIFYSWHLETAQIFNVVNKVHLTEEK